MSTISCVEDVLEEHIPAEKLAEVKRILYGNPVDKLPVPESAAKLSADNDFEIRAYKVPAAAHEDLREPRIVRIGMIQNDIGAPTDAPIGEQYQAIEDKLRPIIDAAGEMGVNVLCLQEAWTAPFFFCTREKHPWNEFGEEAETGRSTQFIKAMAKKHNMVIISPIYERDGAHQDTMWNTAVVIGNNGNYIGKHRKNHIPRVGDFNESTYYMEGDTGHPVFETVFGKIGINICYGRHHVLNWLGFAINGAEIVFNPSATVGALSEPMWCIEARNAAIANNYYVGGINRVGTESFPNEFTSADGKPAHKDFGAFYGSTYLANPNASRTPGLSRDRNGLHVSEVDLNLCRQIKDKWCLQMTARYPYYADFLANYIKPDFKPHVIKDPEL